MKSYDETIATVLDRIENYHIKKKRNKKIAISVTVPLCAIIVCAAGLLLYPRHPAASPDTQISAPSVDTPICPAPTQAPIQSTDNIIINPLGDNTPENSMLYALMTNDFIPMSLEELEDYYGSHIIPQLPDDLKRTGLESYGLYRRENGTGEIYHDQNIQRFISEDQSRALVVETRKGRLPFHDIVIYNPEAQSSVINDTIVDIGINEHGHYFVWFMFRDVGFYIFAQGLTEAELIAAISSLTQ